MQAIRRQDMDWGNAARFTVRCDHVNRASFSTKERKLSYRQLMKASDNTEFRNRRLKKNEETTRRKWHRES
jgi:hypothetical protein